MKESEKLVGKTKTHPKLGKVLVTSIQNNSRVLVNVECIDRGEGYDEATGKYKGVKVKGGWYRGENRLFGVKEVAHIKILT